MNPHDRETEAEVTQEVWSLALTPRIDPNSRAGNYLPEPNVEISIERGAHGAVSDDMLVLSGEGSEFNRARARLAVRAPTFYRLLEQVLKLDTIPDDLRDVIQTNLHRATPNRYKVPDHKNRPRNAWEKLLRDDLV